MSLNKPLSADFFSLILWVATGRLKKFFFFLYIFKHAIKENTTKISSAQKSQSQSYTNAIQNYDFVTITLYLDQVANKEETIVFKS